MDANLAGGVAALLLGDTNSYREFSEHVLGSPLATTNRGWARTAAEVGLLRPELQTNVGIAFKFGDGALEEEWDIPGQIAKGMTEYRRGRLDQALKSFEVPRRCFRRPALAAQAGYFCAMIHHRQGDSAAAAEAMRQAGKRLEAVVRRG